MNTSKLGSRHVYGKEVDGWRWLWHGPVFKLRSPARTDMLAVRHDDPQGWHWFSATPPRSVSAASFMDAVEAALASLGLPATTHMRLLQIARMAAKELGEPCEVD